MRACGKTKNSKWSFVSPSCVELRERLVERRRAIDAAQRERRHAAQRHGGDHAERPDADPRGEKGIAVALLRARKRLAVGEHELDRLDLRRDVAQRGAGAVRCRRDRAGDRLHVDVAEVLQREPVRRERGIQGMDRDATLDAHQPARTVEVEHAVHPLEAQRAPVGAGDVAERVAAADHADALAGNRCPLERGDDPGDAAGPLDRRGLAALVASPIAPHAPSLRPHGSWRHA